MAAYFDVKPLSAIYFDKPMKAHGLMQAIVRANRVSEGKSNGLIVDYIGVVKALRKVLADYTRDSKDGPGDELVFDKEELLDRVKEPLEAIGSFLGECGFDLDELLRASDFEVLFKVKKAANAVSESGETRKWFGIMARELSKLFKFIKMGRRILYRRAGWVGHAGEVPLLFMFQAQAHVHGFAAFSRPAGHDAGEGLRGAHNLFRRIRERQVGTRLFRKDERKVSNLALI